MVLAQVRREPRGSTHQLRVHVPGTGAGILERPHGHRRHGSLPPDELAVRGRGHRSLGDQPQTYVYVMATARHEHRCRAVQVLSAHIDSRLEGLPDLKEEEGRDRKM